ncbi:hypothetical protein F5887DRAFT_912390, partial [Amanita rubescens]
MHSFITTILSGFSSRIINAYANLNTSNANPQQHQPNEQNSCQHAEPRSNNPGLWQMWAGATRISYCHHERTGSAGSTEYWVWNGPEDHELETSRECTTPIPRSSSIFSLSEFPEQTALPSSEGIEPSAVSGDHVVDRAPLVSDDSPSLTLDMTTTLLESGDLDAFKFNLTPDLPSEPLSPLLLMTRSTLDEEASRFYVGLTNGKTIDEPSLPIGLGIYGLKRQEDPSHIFDGLGIIRLQSSPWSSRLESNGPNFSGNDSAVHTQPEDLDDHSCLSQTFLHDLEAFFLVKDLADDCGPTVEIIVEEPESAEVG